MKIHPGNQIVKQTNPETKAVGKLAGKKSFTAFFEESVAKSSEQIDARAMQPPAVSRIDEIRLTSVSPTEKIPIVNRVEKILDVLDEYRVKLGDPKVTLKEIYPLIGELDAHEKSLIPALNSLPDEDDLKEILNQVLITSSLEVIRFTRGDYITPAGSI